MNRDRHLAAAVFAASSILTALPLAANEAPAKRRLPVEITLHAPDSGSFRGLTTTSGWAIVLRIDAPRGVAIVETPEEPTMPVGRREAIVLTDPDGCLDMRHFPITRAGEPFEDCAGPDETFLEFTTERIDSFDFPDGQTGNFEVRDQLLDDAFEPGALLDKPYLLTNAGVVEPVPRPQTGGALLDGYGFGPDDDLVSAVVMVDLGPTRVFDEKFDRSLGPVIRNMAGFFNSVAQELLTRRGGPALTAYMHVQGGMFEPIAVFDLDVDAPDTDFLRRVDSGLVEGFRFLGNPQSDDETLRELLSTYGPYEVVLRVALVDGVAPTFIRDTNLDGRYNAGDLRRMGYEVVSNEARLRLAIDFDALVTDTITGRTCPPPSLLYRDLDGNGADGAISCSGSGGAARVRRVPR